MQSTYSVYPKGLIQAKQQKIDAEGLTTTFETSAPNGARFRLIVANPTERPRTFCDYHFPVEGIRNDLFELRDSRGREIPYRGIMAKRIPPGLNNFWTAPAGERVVMPVDISGAYSLQPGRYEIRFRGNAVSGLPASNTLELTITEKAD